MAIRTTSSSSIRSASSVFASLGSQLAAAQAIKSANDYANGDISDDQYIKILKQQKVSTTSPTQAQSLQNQIDDLEISVARTKLKNQVDSGEKTIYDLASWDKQRLDSMVPGSVAAIKQQGIYQSDLKNAVTTARSQISQQVQNGIASLQDVANFEKGLTPVYKEAFGDNSQEHIDQIYRSQDADRAVIKGTFNDQKRLQDAQYALSINRSQSQGDYTGAIGLANKHIQDLQKRAQDNAWVYTNPDGSLNTDGVNLENTIQNVSNTITNIQNSAVTAQEQATKKGQSNAASPLLFKNAILKDQLSALDKGFVTTVDSKGNVKVVGELSKQDGNAYLQAKQSLTTQLMQDNENLISVYSSPAYMAAFGDENITKIATVSAENQKYQDQITNEIAPFTQGGRSNVIDVWDGSKFVPTSIGSSNLDHLDSAYGGTSSTNSGNAVGYAELPGNRRVLIGSKNQAITIQKDASGATPGNLPEGSQVVRTGDQVMYREGNSGVFKQLPQDAYLGLLSDKNSTLLTDLGFSPEEQKTILKNIPGATYKDQPVQYPNTFLSSGGTPYTNPDGSTPAPGGVVTTLKGIDQARQIVEQKKTAEEAAAEKIRQNFANAETGVSVAQPSIQQPTRQPTAPAINLQGNNAPQATSSTKIKVTQPTPQGTVKVASPAPTPNISVAQPTATPNLSVAAPAPLPYSIPVFSTPVNQDTISKITDRATSAFNSNDYKSTPFYTENSLLPSFKKDFSGQINDKDLQSLVYAIRKPYEK